MAKERSNKSRLLMWVTYGVIVTALVGTTTLSRYMTTVSGTGSATVASVYVDTTLAVDLSGLENGTPVTVNFDIVNYTGTKASDVTMGYQVEVITTGNLPVIYSLAPRSEADATVLGTMIDNTFGNDGAYTGGTLTGGVLPHSECETHEYTLTATWDTNAKDADYADEVDAVKIVITSSQITEEAQS